MAPKLAKIWSVYEDAKRDYHEKSNHEDDSVKFKAAKFLRDTAENILIQLKGKNTDENMLMELNSTFNMAKAMVVSLSGGKKRKFDPVAMDSVKGIPRGPSSEFASQSHTENPTETLAHRGRTRTQRPPPTLGRDERRWDERYSYDERYPRDGRHAEGHGHTGGYDDRYNGGDDARSARPYHRNYDGRYPGNLSRLSRIDDEEYGRRLSREWCGTDYARWLRLRRERSDARRGQGDEGTDDDARGPQEERTGTDAAGRGQRHGHGGSDDARYVQRDGESHRRSEPAAEDRLRLPRADRGTEDAGHPGPTVERYNALRGQRYGGRHGASDDIGHGQRHEGSDHVSTDHAGHGSQTDDTTYERDDRLHCADSPTRGSTIGPFHPRRNVDSYQPGRDY